MQNKLSFKMLMLSIVLLIVVVLASSGDWNIAKLNRPVAQAGPISLEVNTHVTGQNYCYLDSARDSLILKLHVRLSNRGASTIILRKDGVVKAEVLVNKNASSGERNVLEFRASPPFAQPRGVEPPLGKLPDERFVILKSGDSYELDDSLEIPVVRDASRIIPGAIIPGEHSLQIKYFTWLDSPSLAARMRGRWNSIGELFTDTIVSEPMIFHVAPNQGMQVCRLVRDEVPAMQIM